MGEKEEVSWRKYEKGNQSCVRCVEKGFMDLEMHRVCSNPVVAPLLYYSMWAHYARCEPEESQQN